MGYDWRTTTFQEAQKQQRQQYHQAVVRRTRPKGRVRQFLGRNPVIASIMAGVFCLIVYANIQPHHPKALAYVAAALIVLPLVYVALGLIWLLWKGFSKAWDQAITPVPDLMQIKAQLEAEGYTNLTLADLTAVHGYLTRQRNAGLLVVGGVLGGVYLAHRDGVL